MSPLSGIGPARNKPEKPLGLSSRLIDSDVAVTADRVKPLATSERILYDEGGIAALQAHTKAHEIFVPDCLPWAHLIDDPLRDPDPLCAGIRSR